MRHAAGLGVMLAAFWLLLSGHYTPLLLALGAVSVALVTALAHRMDLVDHEGRPLQLSLRAPGYWWWLGGQMLLSSWDVSRRIWARTPRIAPVVRRTPTRDMSEMLQVIYANSITLTPGTLSVTVHDDGIDVHALDDELVDALERSAMARRARRMESA